MKLGLRFDERMAGWICLQSPPAGAKLEAGVRYPFEMNLHVFSSAILRFTKPRQTRGYVLLPGAPLTVGSADALEAPAIHGTMTTTPGGVAYDLTFSSIELGELQLRGKKTYAWGSFSLSRLIRSMTTLPLELWKGTEKIGTGELVYRAPLWELPVSMKIVQERYAFDRLLALSERLVALAPVFVSDPSRFITTEELTDRIRQQISGVNALEELATRFAVRLVRTISWLRFAKPVSRLNPQQRETLAQLFQRRRFLRELTLPASVPILSGTFSAKSFLDKKHQHLPVPPTTPEPEERWMSLNTTPTASDTPTEVEVDIAIVGSGAGGAAAAFELASQGHAVAVVEEGHYFRRQAFNGSRIDMMNRLFRNQGRIFPLSNTIIWTPAGRCVGGTTTINSGTCFRTPDDVMDRWARELGLTDLGLKPLFTEVEQMLDAKVPPTALHGPLREILAKGLEGTPYQAEPLVRAETGCDGQSLCILGCPAGAKRSTDVSYMPEAMKKNAFLFSHYQVEEILFDGDRAIGLRAQLPGYGKEFSLTIKAKAVILAAGTNNTPWLLWKAGLGRKLPQLGKNLTLHPALTVGAVFDKQVRPRMFVPQSLGLSSIRQQEHFVLEGYTLAIDAIPLAMSVFGKELDELMSRAECFTNFSAMIEDSARGGLLMSRRGAQSYYFFDRELKERMKRSLAMIIEIFFKAGAQSVYVPVRGFDKCTSISAATRIRKARLAAIDFLNTSAYHPLGTCRMGTDPSNSVISRDGAVWGTKGLYVADGSAIPGPLGVNPQVTIMANSIRIARALGNQLK